MPYNDVVVVVDNVDDVLVACQNKERERKMINVGELAKGFFDSSRSKTRASSDKGSPRQVLPSRYASKQAMDDH